MLVTLLHYCSGKMLQNRSGVNTEARILAAIPSVSVTIRHKTASCQARDAAHACAERVNPEPRRLRRQTANLKHALGQGAGTPKRLPARHRHDYDLFVEVSDPKIEITGTEHLRYPCGLRLVRGARAHPPPAAVNQPILPALLESISQAPGMALAEPKKLSSLDTTEASRPMRADPIENSRHQSLWEYSALRSKTGQTTRYQNRTCQVLSTSLLCALTMVLLGLVLRLLDKYAI